MRTPATTQNLVLVAAIVALAAAACQPAEHHAAAPAAPTAPDYAAEYGPLFDTLIEVWNSREYDRLDAIAAFDFQRIAPDVSVNSLPAWKEFMQQVHAAYPDFAIVMKERGYGPGVAFGIWTVNATDSGEGGSGNPIEVTGATMLRIKDGKITHEVVFFDSAALTEQVGGSEMPHAG